MKKLLTLAALVGTTFCASAQGTFNWANTAATLISADGVAIPVAATSPFNFAVLWAPSDTVNEALQTRPLLDAVFANLGNYNNNTTAAGRIQSRTALVDLSNTAPAGSTRDFIIVGWSGNAGATLSEAIAFWNNGQPAADMFLGQSSVGNNFVLGGGAIPNAGLMGAGGSQVGGFNLALYPAVPEPSSMALAGLGAAALVLFRRRK